MSEPFMGQIELFGFQFAPRDWAYCNGQIINVAQNAALYSLLGTAYGGDGRNTFGLPDLQCRAPIHKGQGTGLPPRPIAEKLGNENITLVVGELPQHIHSVDPKGVDATGTSLTPVNAVFAKSGDGRATFETTPGARVDMAAIQTSPVGLSQNHNNMQPFLTLNFCICLYGYYPTRD